MSKIVTHEGESSRQWIIDEVYQGPPLTPGKQYHVPNVNDVVIDFARGFYRVSAVDPDTQIPQLERWKPSELGTTAEDQNLDAGLSRNYARGTNRAFVNYSVSPPTLNLDARTYIYDREAVKGKIYRGMDTSADGMVISRVYDTNNVFISDTFDLYKIDPNNQSMKQAPTIKLDTLLEEGEVVTLVAYSSNGGAIYSEPFVTRLTDSMQPVSVGNKYLVDISLVSDLIDPNNITRILNDLNVPLQTTLMRCKLHYNDGSTDVVDIDGNKVKLYGIDGFNESVLGPRTHVSLNYLPSAEERAINLVNGNTPTKVKVYTLANRRGEANFAFKLYVIPEYGDVSLGYTLRYFITNLEYDINLEVTDSVTTTLRGGGAWSPTGYGVKQSLSTTLRTQDVFPDLYDNYIHIQDYDIILDVPTIAGGNSWIIDYQGDGDRILGFGLDVEASNLNRRMLIQNEHINLADWLDKLYYEASPAYDQDLVGAPPEPTHFSVYYGGTSIRYPIGSWSEYLYTNNNINFTEFETAMIRWEAVDGIKTRYLAYTPLLVRLKD